MAGLTYSGLWQRRARERARECGKCSVCWKAKVRGVARCHTCRKRLRERHAVAVRNGYCTQCMVRRSGGGTGSRCRPCRVRHRLRAFRYRRERIRQGLCPHCTSRIEPGRSRCKSCKKRTNWYLRERKKLLRSRVLAWLGNKCRCCLESHPNFLNIDHIHNDGYVERRLGINLYSLYLRFERNGSLDRRRYQLLCWNCNLAKYHYGRCPHQAAKRRSA